MVHLGRGEDQAGTIILPLEVWVVGQNFGFRDTRQKSWMPTDRVKRPVAGSACHRALDPVVGMARGAVVPTSQSFGRVV
jgi:hypothetical protein